MQALFDLTALQYIATQWQLYDYHKPTTSNTSTGSSVGLMCSAVEWESQMDPINAELVLPLLKTVSVSHIQNIQLLVPHCQNKTTASNTTSTTTSSGRSNDELLASVFPTTKHSATRFVLLPLSVSTAPTTSNSNTNNNTTSSSSTTMNSRLNAMNETTNMSIIKKNSRSSGNLTATTTSNTTSSNNTATTASVNKNKTTNSVMNWW